MEIKKLRWKNDYDPLDYYSLPNSRYRYMIIDYTGAGLTRPWIVTISEYCYEETSKSGKTGWHYKGLKKKFASLNEAKYYCDTHHAKEVMKLFKKP